jgi:hypothetical protein
MEMYHQDEFTVSKKLVCFIVVYKSLVTLIDKKQKYVRYMPQYLTGKCFSSSSQYTGYIIAREGQ